MTEEYFQSEEFYKLCLRACNFQFSKYYKPYIRDKEDMISNAILAIFEHKKDFEKLEEKELFIKLSKIAKNSFEKDRTKKLKEIYNTSFSLDEEACEGKTYGEFLGVECDKHMEENEGFETLKTLFKDFVKMFDKADMKIVFDYLKGVSFKELRIRYKKHPKDVTSIIKNFRTEFAQFLENAGYLNDTRFLLQDTGKDSCKNDCLVYRLIRESNNIEEVSECLNKSVSALQDILFHNSTRKLLLFEIQKLRDEFFASYSLAELASL